MKHFIKTALIFTLTILLAFSIFSCGKDEKEIVSVSVAGGSVPTEIGLGETLDTSGLKLVVSYDDGSAETVTADKVEIGKVDTTTPGEKTLTVKYKGFSATVKINVKDNTPVTVKTVKIVAGSYPASVKIGDAFSADGIKAEITYTDGSTKIVDYDELTVSAIDTASAGDKTLTVTYEGVSDTATVKVVGIASIVVIANTLPTEVPVGALFDASGAKALVTFDGGEMITVSASDLTISALDTSVIGDYTVAVSYKGVSVDWSVKVVGVTEIEIIESSIPTSVRVRSMINLGCIQVKATYNNGNEVILTGSDVTLSEVETHTAGAQVLTVSYMGLSDTVTINVVGVKAMTPITGTYSGEALVGGAFDIMNIRMQVEYTDGTTETLGIDSMKVTTFGTDEARETKVVFQYLDGEVAVPVRVCGIEKLVIEGIARSVVAGETLDISAMVVKLVYSDSKQTAVTVTEYTTNLDSLDFNEEGDKEFIVTYNGEYGTFEGKRTISTTPPVLEGLVITSYPLYVELGGVYNKAAIRAKAIFGNGDEEDVSALISVADIDTSAAGKIIITVSYEEDGVTVNAQAEISVLPVTKLDVSGLPVKIKLGQTIDYTLVKTTATFSDGTNTVTKEVVAEITEADVSSAGTKTVVISYLGTTEEETVEVIAPTSIKPLAGTFDPAIREGYTPSADGLKLEVTYTDGTKEIIAALGNSDITYSYAPGADGKTYFKVNAFGLEYSQLVKTVSIKDITALNGTVPTTLLIGTSLPSDMKLTVIYVDDEGKEYVYLIGKEDPNLVITEIDTSTAGDKAIYFRFAGREALVVVTVRGVESIEVVGGTVNNVVFVGDTLDTSEILVKVVFSDLTFIYANTSDINLVIGSIDTSEQGEKTLSITYRDKTISYTVTVKNKADVNGDIYGIELPASIVARNTYKNNFKDSTYIYFVGDDNPYIFYLNVLMLDENYELVDVDGRTVPTTSRIFLVNEDGTETELTGDALTAMVVKDDNNNTYDFTEAAIGKTFRLEAKPRDNYFSDATKSHTVKVVDGYNIYSAKELNILTNTDHDLNGGSVEGNLSQLDAVNRFLAENNIVRPANLAGIILHGNINVTMNDLPPEYLHKYTKDGVEKEGIYDWEYVFYHTNGMNGAAPHFTMYGNYYSVYSYNIPCVVENGIANNDDAFSSSSFFRFDAGPIHMDYDHRNYSTTVLGVAFRDNDPNSNDQAASERHMRGLSCLKSSYQIMNVTNTNIDAYTLSMVPEDDDLTVNLDKVKFYNAWQGHLFIWNINAIQEHCGTYNDAPRPLHQNIKINITDSLLAKCGGPVILSQNVDTEYAANQASGADIVVDAESEIYSYVTGQEAWFVAVGHTPLAAQIIAMDGLVRASAQQNGKVASYTSDQKIAGVNTVNMIYVNMGVGQNITEGENYNGTFTRAGVTLNDMTNNQMVDMYIGAVGSQAPIFQSSAGGVAFTDGATGCYGIESGAPGAPLPQFFEGDYLSLYYNGIGLMIEYYH